MLLIVAASEHQARFEVGYGLEGVLTDAATKIILENSVLPRFKAGGLFRRHSCRHGQDHHAVGGGRRCVRYHGCRERSCGKQANPWDRAGSVYHRAGAVWRRTADPLRGGRRAVGFAALLFRCCS
ncbi:MAG: TPM domain-containing protein [Rhodospirillales bacterium]